MVAEIQPGAWKEMRQAAVGSEPRRCPL